MRKLFYVLLITILLLTMVTPALADKPTGFDGQGKALGLVGDAGFDQYGYNRTARIFSGPVSGWCDYKYNDPNCLGSWSNDRLVMKWNAEWDRGNDENWSHPPYAAWENNEWNGMNGGSGEVWHYKIVWVGDCNLDGNPNTNDLLPDGGYCIWGQFEAIFDHYVGQNNNWWAKVAPAGYGAYK